MRIVFIVAALVACDDDGSSRLPVDAAPDASEADGGDAVAPDAAEPDARAPDGAAPEWEPVVEWEGCPLPGGGGECADILVPADWGDPTGPTLEIRVSRVRPGSGFGPRPPALGQVWLLAGGPGQAGSDWAGARGLFERVAPGFEMYMVDFRGTGASSYLACDLGGFEGDREACVEGLQATWGELLPHFTVTASARDVGELAARLRLPDQPLVVIGASFGTYWANRYLQLYPDQPTAVVVDGLCPPGRCDFGTVQDTANNEVARALFDLCAADEVCAEKLDGDPWGFLGDLFERVDAGGHCPPLETDHPGLAAYIAGALFDPSARDFLPAVMYRFARCEPGDVAAIEHYNERVFGASGGVNGGWSDAARFHVVASELFPDPPPTAAEVEALHRTLYSATRDTVFLAWVAEVWPRYPRDQWVGGFAETDVPMLMLNGTLDPATSPGVAEGYAEAFTGTHQHYVPLAWVGHGTLGSPCAQTLLQAFLADPEGPLDTSCAATARNPPELNPGAARSRTFFGVDDPWENPAE